MLARGSRTALSGLSIGRFINDQHATALEGWIFFDIVLDLGIDPCRRPRRVAHKLLQLLAILPWLQSALDIGKVALILHRQQPRQ
jgi:hypothetical protein